jgi:cytoskeleton protein RodZ
MGTASYDAGGGRPRGQPDRRSNRRTRERARPGPVRLVETPASAADNRAAATMNFGDHLRAARTARGISVRDISARTRIALRSLEALEQNEVGKLPGGIFSRAFVRAYAQEVGLDPDETVRLFVQQFPIDHVTAGSTDAVEGEIGRGQEALRRRQRLGYLLTAAVGIPLVGLAAYLISSARRPANASDLATSASSAAVTPGAAGAAAANGAGAGEASSSVEKTSSVAKPVGASTGAATPTSLSLIATPAGAPASLTANKGTAASALPTPATLRMAISAAGPCWIRVKSDGAIRYQGLLKAGDEQTGDARDNFELIVGDAATFRYSINGRPGRTLGKSGEVVVAHITRANWQNWLQQ